MPRKFSLHNDEFEIPSVGWLEAEWGGAAHHDLAREIAFQEQFRKLFRWTFSNLRSVPAENPHYNPRRLDLSARAGALKTYVLLTVSIAEAALSALGEERNLGRQQGELYRLTFGRLLERWKENDAPKPEVAEIWEELQLLNRYRNFVHLNRAAADDEGWQGILDNEARIVAASDKVVGHLGDLCHVFRD